MPGDEASNTEPSGDFDAEVSDTRTNGAPPDRATAPFAQQRTPRLRLARQAGIAAMVLLALLVVTGGIPALRDRAIGLIGPPPAPKVVPGTDEFTFLPNPPGVTISLDGHALAHPPTPGEPHPVRLAPGRHTFAWQSRIYPCVPQSCVVSVPPASTDSCEFVNADELRAQGVQVRGNVLATHAALFTIQPDEIAALEGAIHVALVNSTSSATVQPGEPYYTIQPSGAGGYTIAKQPLRATLTLLFASPKGASGPCDLGVQFNPCRFFGQNCAALCTVPAAPASVTTGVDGAWIAAALVNAAWTYTAPEGRMEASNVGPGIGTQLVSMRITWDSALWHVTPIFGHTAGLPAADDLACDDASFWVANSSFSFMLTDPPPGAQVDFISRASPIDGCLVILSQAPGSATPALFLERFGLLLTLNNAARGTLDGFPPASGADQQIAQALAARAGITLLG